MKINKYKVYLPNLPTSCNLVLTRERIPFGSFRTPWVNQLVAQMWLNLLMDDYHFAPWVNRLVAQIWVNLLMDDYHFDPLSEPACSPDVAKSSYG